MNQDSIRITLIPSAELYDVLEQKSSVLEISKTGIIRSTLSEKLKNGVQG